jgi:Flp pilus assembly protein CpaB
VTSVPRPASSWPPWRSWSSATLAAQRFVAARRRTLTALLVGLAVLSGLSAVRPPAPPTTAVLVAARDLPPGTALAAADLGRAALPSRLVPAGALRPGASVVGRLVAGAVRRGEPLTDVRLLGPALLAGYAADAVAVPLRFADPGAVALLRPGDRIDVLAAPADSFTPGIPAPPGDPASSGNPASSGDPTTPSAPASPGGPAPPNRTARVVAADVAVVLVTTTGSAALDAGPLVVVACSPAVARALAAAGAAERLSPALRSPPARGP